MYADAELLRRYAEGRSETAFAELVHRHLNLVYAVAVRQCGGDTHLAEDVTQSVFTDLARKAAALAGRPVLSGWLYRAAQFAATDVVRGERRRRAREQEAQAMQELSTNPATDADWNKLRPVLDQAMGELSEHDRDAVMLRYVEGRAFAAIGATLRLSEDAARMRVDRALDRLRVLLAKRDITSTSAALATVLAHQAAGTAPAGLAASVTSAALSGGIGAELGALAAVLAFMTATKTTVVLGVTAVLTVATAVYQSTEARTAAVKLTVESRALAAERDRVAELAARVRAAEQALADRGTAGVRPAAAATSGAPPAAGGAASEAAQQKALQRYLDTNPELRTIREDYDQAYKRANNWPVFLGLGLTMEQAELAQTVTEDIWLRRKARMDAGDKEALPDYSRLRAAFGDALVERWAEFNRVRWLDGEIVRQFTASFCFADEPLTAKQTAGLIQILDEARMKGKWEKEKWSAPVATFYEWDKILPRAESLLSTAQMRGLRAKAATARMDQMEAAAKTEAAAAAKP